MRDSGLPKLDRPLRAIKPSVPKRNRRCGGSRICESENCQTVLSVYNDSRRCWLHQPFRYPGAPRGRCIAQAGDPEDGQYPAVVRKGVLMGQMR